MKYKGEGKCLASYRCTKTIYIVLIKSRGMYQVKYYSTRTRDFFVHVKSRESKNFLRASCFFRELIEEEEEEESHKRFIEHQLALSLETQSKTEELVQINRFLRSMGFFQLRLLSSDELNKILDQLEGN